MQPLDVAFMGPLEIYYAQEVERFRSNPGRAVTVCQVGELFGRAYMKAAAIGTSSDLTTLQFWTNQMRLVIFYHITRTESPNQGRHVIQILQQQQESSVQPTSAVPTIETQITAR
jgi:hypothetical protein